MAKTEVGERMERVAQDELKPIFKDILRAMTPEERAAIKKVFGFHDKFVAVAGHKAQIRMSRDAMREVEEELSSGGG